MRSTIAKIVGSWARANYFPKPVIMEIIVLAAVWCDA